ncbi:hypothetical protein PHLGIDRAFT_401549 [Phlebiopsis gigantea 11061_1 CR5-6]|uniref:M-phase inducer phosphatase n=1 Tax=Phlebiopsis gigantea (strain 11061_1 CR5-6) TaxID=745531 RepID=A0A0C3PMS7_PHLG1|nr:hypothetical protein PHLGIDRAFT_401549 [Phlebiopsis gigantea 11061_1 CR5-6]
MSLFSRAIPALRLSAHPTREDEINAFLSSDVHATLDLEESFASSMSLNSPSRARHNIGLPDTPDTDRRGEVPMDISPAPPRVFHAPPPQQPQSHQLNTYSRRNDRETNHTLQLPLPTAPLNITKGRPRSNTGSNARLFGTDVSNAREDGKTSQERDAEKDVGTAGRKLQRAALPFEWMTSGRENETSEQHADAPSSPDAMDVDMTFSSQTSSSPESPAPISAAPTITQFNHAQLNIESISGGRSTAQFENYFYRSSSPIGAPDFHDDASASMSTFESEAPAPKKRRSVSPDLSQRRRSRTLQLLDESTDLESSPAAAIESPSVHKLERLNSKPALRALPLPAPAANINTKRLRRPVLSTIVPPGGNVDSMLRSAHPVLERSDSISAPTLAPTRPLAIQPRGAHILPPARRAFSAMIPSSVDPMASFASSADASCDDSVPDLSSPAAAYAQRQQVKTIRRRDGTDDFRSVTGATALLQRDSEMLPRRGAQKPASPVSAAAGMERDTPRSKYLSGSGGKLGGFGDNEASGKALPCHRVPEDGLMRITWNTLDQLLDGKYDEQIKDYLVIDCRFAYEYNGGHIPGAINLNTPEDVEEFFLGESSVKPPPSMSGDGGRNTILIFHCEFSQKRAPTYAKHLRSRDRIVNSEQYPRIYYPEVYILEGGYCQYFKQSGARCQPPAYVSMDDPKHAGSRREDMDQFRKAKFGRTKSCGFGEGRSALLGAAPAAVAPKRNSAPTGAGGAATTLFAVGNAARTRRTQGMLQTLEEDAGGAVATDCEDDDTDIGDSPCPPPTRGISFKGAKMPRMPMARAETYGPSRFAH